MFQDVFIIGASGKVGRTLIKQIFGKGDNDEKLHNNPTRIVGLASSKMVYYNLKGVSKDEVDAFLNEKLGKPLDRLDNILDLVDNNKKIIFIDVTALREEMIKFQLRVIEETNNGIVSANKNPLAFCDFITFESLILKTSRYGYRCSVMAGAEAVDKIKDLRDLGDMPLSIEGCFSGTLGYICSDLNKGKIFSEIVNEAKELGYTEPNVADDLNGKDVAKKILILARTAGFKINFEDIELIPFIPEEYLKNIDKISELNDYFKEKVAKAGSKGCVLRYVARFDGSSIKVGLEEVKKDSPLGMLKGTLNKMVITTSYGDYSIEAPGAGLEITAQNIRRDLLYQLDERVLRK